MNTEARKDFIEANVMFRHGRFGGRFIYAGKYLNELGERLTVGLCNISNCPHCRGAIRVEKEGVYKVKLQLVEKEENGFLFFGRKVRKSYIAHDPRNPYDEVVAKNDAKEEIVPKTAVDKHNNDVDGGLGFARLPSLDFNVPKMPEPGVVRLVNLSRHSERVGASCYAYDDGKETLIVDCGMDVGRFESGFGDNGFGEITDERLPNFKWISTWVSRIKAIVITHGHLDHIGAIPFLPPEVLGKVVIYATRFAAELIKRQCRVHKRPVPQIVLFEPGDVLKFGEKIVVETFPVAHSIPEAVGLLIKFGEKRIVHLSDFKFRGVDYKDEKRLVGKLEAIAAGGRIDFLTMDVLNAKEDSMIPEERLVFQSIRGIIAKTPISQRIIISFFGTNAERMRAIIGIAREVKRKLTFIGKTIEEVYAITRELGMVDEAPKEGFGEIYCVTGCQAEPGSCLARLATRTDDRLFLQPGDVIIISSRPIPGNGRRFEDMVCRLEEQRVVVYLDSKDYSRTYSSIRTHRIIYKDYLHVSGHGNFEDHVLAVYLLSPSSIYPVHAPRDSVTKFRERIADYLTPKCKCVENDGLPIII